MKIQKRNKKRADEIRYRNAFQNAQKAFKAFSGRKTGIDSLKDVQSLKTASEALSTQIKKPPSFSGRLFISFWTIWI